MLLPGRSWMAAVLLAVAGAFGTAFLGARYAHESYGGHLDDEVRNRLVASLGQHHQLTEAVSRLGGPTDVTVATVLLTLACLVARRWRSALFTAVSVPASAFVTEVLLKPHVGRTLGVGLSFPSGHTTGATAVAVVLGVLLLRVPGPWPLRALVALAALATAVGVAVSLVADEVHYATDTVGGACVALTVVLCTALILDLLPDRGRVEA